MGSGEDESQPSTSNGKSCKLTRTFLDGCDADNRVSIPRKLRSVVKRRGREFITSPLQSSRKQRHGSIADGTLKKDGAQKSKLNMKKRRHVTKDEEEVAETLYALAGFFSDANKADQLGLDDKKPEIKSPSSMNAARDTSPTLQEGTRKNSPKETLEAVFPSSNLRNSTAEQTKSQKLEAQRELSPCSSSRPLVSMLGINQNGEQEIHMDRVIASVSQYGKNCSSFDDKYKGLLVPPNATGTTSSEMHQSYPRTHSLFESTNFSSHSCAINNKITVEKHARVAPESNTPWKRCSSHVYISRLIKVMQISGRKEEFPLQPTRSTTCRGAEQQSNVSIHNQMPRIIGRNGDSYFSVIDSFAAKSSNIQSIPSDKRLVQDQQMASEPSALCSAKQEYDFLSLGTGQRSSDSGRINKGEGETRHQFHMPSQNHSSMPQNGYSSSSHGHNSALAAQQVQIPQYNSNTVSFGERRGQQTESQQQKWARYNTSRGRVPTHSPSMLHSLFPHLHANYQHLSPSQYQQLMPINSNVAKLHHCLPLGFARSGAVFQPENVAHLSCNQHL